MNMVPYVYAWIALAMVVIGLAIYRQRVARHDEGILHLAEKGAALLNQQTAVGRKIQKIDFWGQWFTVIAILYGLALLDIYVHGVWVAGAKLPR